MGVSGVPWNPQILANQLTLSQPCGADYAHHDTTGLLGISDLRRPCICFTAYMASLLPTNWDVWDMGYGVQASIPPARIVFIIHHF